MVFQNVFGAVNGLREFLDGCLVKESSEATIRKGERNAERTVRNGQGVRGTGA
jgi:hypothetical protein